MKKSEISTLALTAFMVLFLSIANYSQTAQQEKSNPQKVASVSEGEQLIEKYGCLTCHKTYGPKTGPAFHGVSIKYRNEYAENAADSIALFIKKGSKGKYPCSATKDAVMPQFNIPIEERLAIANWIVSLRPMKDMIRKSDEQDEK